MERERQPFQTRHHTLYPASAYGKSGDAHSWRGHTLMIFRIPSDIHNRIHREIPPLWTPPSVELGKFGLSLCRQTAGRPDTKLHNFLFVRDELHKLSYELGLRQELGREALLFCNFLSDQVDILRDYPVLDEDYLRYTA